MKAKEKWRYKCTPSIRESSSTVPDNYFWITKNVLNSVVSMTHTGLYKADLNMNMRVYRGEEVLFNKNYSRVLVMGDSVTLKKMVYNDIIKKHLLPVAGADSTLRIEITSGSL